jgi:hypothetical protein
MFLGFSSRAKKTAINGSPSARTMRGLGTCSFELRNYVDAIQWFEQALSSNTNAFDVSPAELRVRGSF